MPEVVVQGILDELADTLPGAVDAAGDKLPDVFAEKRRDSITGGALQRLEGSLVYLVSIAKSIARHCVPRFANSITFSLAKLLIKARARICRRQ